MAAQPPQPKHRLQHKTTTRTSPPRHRRNQPAAQRSPTGGTAEDRESSQPHKRNRRGQQQRPPDNPYLSSFFSLSSRTAWSEAERGAIAEQRPQEKSIHAAKRSVKCLFWSLRSTPSVRSVAENGRENKCAKRNSFRSPSCVA